jgi:hypothetical protein
MRFDPHSGFDAEARAAIAATLWPGADLEWIIEHLQPFARGFSPRYSGDLIQRRARLKKERKIIAEAAHVLRTRKPLLRHADHNAEEARSALALVERDMKIESDVWNLLIGARKGGADPDYDILCGGALQVWKEAGGRTAIATDPFSGHPYGPVIDYLRTVSLAVSGETLGPSGFRHLVERWEEKRMPSKAPK